MIPHAGATVLYKLNQYDVSAINRQRNHGEGSQGNPVREGAVYPLLIARVWSDTPNERTAVNGQVILDGPDTLWVTSRQQGAASGEWLPV